MSKQFSKSYCPVEASINAHLDWEAAAIEAQDYEEYTERARCKCGRFFQRTTFAMQRESNMQTRCLACIRKGYHP